MKKFCYSANAGDILNSDITGREIIMNHEEHCRQILENLSLWASELRSIIDDMNKRSEVMIIGYGEG